MAINVSNSLVEYLKGSILFLVECYLCLSDVFFSIVYILRDRGQNYICFSCVLREQKEK